MPSKKPASICNCRTWGTAGQPWRQLAGGSLQFGYANTFTLIQAFQKGIPLKLVAPGAMYTSKAPTIKLLVAADSTIQTGKDLIGKTIGTSASRRHSRAFARGVAGA